MQLRVMSRNEGEHRLFLIGRNGRRFGPIFVRRFALGITRRRILLVRLRLCRSDRDQRRSEHHSEADIFYFLHQLHESQAPSPASCFEFDRFASGTASSRSETAVISQSGRSTSSKFAALASVIASTSSSTSSPIDSRVSDHAPASAV